MKLSRHGGGSPLACLVNSSVWNCVKSHVPSWSNARFVGNVDRYNNVMIQKGVRMNGFKHNEVM